MLTLTRGKAMLKNTINIPTARSTTFKFRKSVNNYMDNMRSFPVYCSVLGGFAPLGEGTGGAGNGMPG